MRHFHGLPRVDMNYEPHNHP